ncbi:ParA family protein [Janibacter sp. FSL W8-0316]|uniref:ParA family protein n=1 Tax=Janibacter sp. FSL W8-0316 TaxID=2975325 RepID=UPI0030FC9668
MDDLSEALRRVVVVANRKGGVLKSSIVRNVADVASHAGYRVAVIDGDPQGNLSEIDFGVDTDGGRGLAMALQYGTDLAPVSTGGVDVICGGPELQGAIGAAMMPGSEVSMEQNLRAALARLTRQRAYDLVLIDSGPGDTRLLDAYLWAARWLIVPTLDDEAALAGVDKMGQRFVAAKRAGADVEFLGAVVGKVNPRATARNAEVRREVEEMLGEEATPFDATIRYDAAGRVDARRHAMSARDVAEEAVRQAKARLDRVKGGTHAPGDVWWSNAKNAGQGLAQDYENLTREVLTRIGAKEAAA